jgi:hypothetical protein
MDIARLGQAISRPGIDPRTWVSMAIALDDSKVDPAFGVYVNVQLLPSGEKYTAIVGADYAGPGFGLYSPIKAGDDLVVMIPNGDPRVNVQVIRRLWSAAGIPPAEAVLDPTEVMLIVEPNSNLRLKVTGTGNIELDSASSVTVNCPDVRLGDLAPTDYAADATLVDNVLQVIVNLLCTWVVTPQDGGLALQTAAKLLWPDSQPATTACTTTKVK